MSYFNLKPLKQGVGVGVGVGVGDGVGVGVGVGVVGGVGRAEENTSEIQAPTTTWVQSRMQSHD